MATGFVARSATKSAAGQSGTLDTLRLVVAVLEPSTFVLAGFAGLALDPG